MVAQWPAELPQKFMIEGLSDKLSDGRLQTNMSYGPPKARRRSSNQTRAITAEIPLTYAMRARLDRFWNEDIAGGSLPFVMTDPLYDAVPLLMTDGTPLLTTAGTPIIIASYWLAFMAQPPQITTMGAKFMAQLNLAVLNK